nr:Gag-Pol polyprotein [Tanacetum cinerariifolium]
MTSLEDINDPTEAMNAALILFSKAFQLSAPTNNNQRILSNPRNRQIAQPYAGQVAQNQQGFNAWQNGGIQGAQNAGLRVLESGIKPGATTVEDWLIAQKEEAGIQLQAEEFDFIAVAGDLDEIEEVNANCILMANLQQTSTSGTQHDRAPIYDTNGSAKVHLNDNCYDNEIFNMFTQEEQYTDLLEPIPEPQLVPQNDNHVTSVAPSMVHSGGTIEISSASNEEIRAHQETVYRNLVDQVSQVNRVNSNMRATNSEIKSELARYKIQEQRVEISQEKYEKLEKWVFVPQTTKSKEELFLLNVSNMVTASKTISIPNEDLSDDTTPSVARKFLNEVKSSLVTLQRVVKQKMTLEVHNWSSSAHKELRDLKGKSSDTPSASNTLDLLNHKLESKIVELEFQVVNYEREICHLKTTYKNLFDSIKSNRARAKLHDLIFENTKLRARLFENTFESVKNTLGTSVTPRVDKPKLSAVTPLSKKLHVSMPSHFVPQPREFNVMKHRNVIAPGMFKINPSQTPRVDLVPNKQSSASIRINPITNSQRHVIVKENVSSNMATASSTGLVHTARTRRPQPKGNTRNVRVPSASKSSEVKKSVTVEDHRRTLLLSKNQKTMSSEKSKRASHPPKPVPNSKQRLHLLHMDLYGPMRVASINGKWYVLVIVDDYSRYTWVHFLRTKDEMPKVIKNFMEKIYVRLQAPVIIVHTDNRTEFKNHVLKEYFDSVGITHETSTAKTPQQNGVVKRKNRTLVEAARTMLIFSHAPLFLWAEAIATVCYTQNRSIIQRCFNKTPYELIQGRKPNISYLHVFRALCYPKNDRKDIGKLGAKRDIGFFIGYSANSVAYRVYNQRTRKIIETMNVTFDELSAMDFEQNKAPRAIPVAPVKQNLQAPTASMSVQDSAPVPTNSSNTPVSSHNVDATSQQHAQQQRNLTSSPTASAADNTIKEALTDPTWIESMQEELHQFIRL